jgi:fructose-1,6-bisphosphatase/inositol monophosphatase family enzyme
MNKPPYHRNTDLNERIEFALSLIEPTGRMLLGYFLSGVSYGNKSDGSVVSKADTAVEIFLKNEISRLFAFDRIISEETDERSGSSEYTWTIDPIDGTLSFVSGVPFYACLISIIYQETPVFGLAIFPSMDEYVFGIEDLGTFWKKQGCEAHTKISHVASRESVEKLVWGYTDLKFFNTPHLQKLLSQLKCQFQYSRSWGDAYGHILVATQRIGLMVDPSPCLKLWDISPLLPIVQNAGGRTLTLPMQSDLFQASGLISCHSDKMHTFLIDFFNAKR